MRTFERLDDLVRWLLTAVIGLLPFFFISVSWASAGQEKMMLVAVLVLIAGILWIIARFSEGSTKLPWSWVLAFAAIVPALYAVSTALSGFTSMSLVGTGEETDTLAFVCMGFATLALSSLVFAMHPRKVSFALRMLVVGGLVLTVIEVIHFIVPALSLGGVLAGQTANVFGGWHEFAMFLGLVLFLSATLIGTPVSAGYARYVLWAAGVLSLLLLVIANYFDVWAILFVASVIYIVVKGYRGKVLSQGSFWRREWLPLAIAIAAIFFAVFGTFIVNVLPSRIQIGQNEVRPSLQGTLAVGQQSLSKPATLLFGAGPNSFTRQWGLYKPVDINQTPFWNTDFTVGVASIPTSFITVGLLGLLAWIGFMLLVLWTALKFWRSTTETPLVSIALPLSVAVLYVLAFQILAIPGSVMTMLMYLLTGLFLALMVPSYVHERTLPLGKGDSMSWLSLILAALAAIALVVSAGATARVVYAEMLVNRAVVTYNDTQNLDQASSLVQQALRVYPNDDRAHRAAVQLGLLTLQNLIASADPQSDAAKAKLQATLKDTIQNGLDAVTINSSDYQNWLALAGLYAQLAGSNIPGAYENARAAFEKALEQNPTSPVPYINVAQLELLQNNPQAALQDLARAVQLKPDFAAAYYIASQIYASQNDYKNALQAAASAAQYASGDSQAWYNLGIIAYAAKDYQDAAGALQQALTIQPQFANALYVLGLSYYQLNDTKDALTVFQALDKLDPGQAAVQQIIDDLQAGRPLPQPTQQAQQAAPQQQTKPVPKK